MLERGSRLRQLGRRIDKGTFELRVEMMMALREGVGRKKGSDGPC